MDSLLKDLKFFLLYHYKNGVSKKRLLALLIKLEDEKKEILKLEYEKDIKNMKPLHIKKYMMEYIEKITFYHDKRLKSKQRRELGNKLN